VTVFAGLSLFWDSLPRVIFPRIKRSYVVWRSIPNCHTRFLTPLFHTEFRWRDIYEVVRLPLIRTSTAGAFELPSVGLIPKVVQSIKDLTTIILNKGRYWKGTWWPSKWKYHHRHGYWATRKKKLKFETYRRYRYHEVKGPGKIEPRWWESNRYYKPLKKAIKFW